MKRRSQPTTEYAVITKGRVESYPQIRSLQAIRKELKRIREHDPAAQLAIVNNITGNVHEVPCG